MERKNKMPSRKVETSTQKVIMGSKKNVQKHKLGEVGQ